MTEFLPLLTETPVQTLFPPQLTSLFFNVRSNNCTWAQTLACPRCPCTAARFTGRPVPNAAWQGTLTARGTAPNAPDIFPWRRGAGSTLSHSHYEHYVVVEAVISPGFVSSDPRLFMYSAFSAPPPTQNLTGVY